MDNNENILTIGKLKSLLSKLEHENGNIDDMQIWVQPPGTPSCESVGAGLIKVSSNDKMCHGREVLGIYIYGDVF
jgi:hypothetical protein